MATRKNTFLLKRSNVAGNVPTAGQVALGELALNTADVKLYASGTTTNSIIPIGWDRIARTGDTMSGTLYVPTISATTYQNLPLDIRVTGGTYAGGVATFTNNTGGTFTVNGFSSSSTGLTPSDYVVQGKLNTDQSIPINTDTIIQFIDDVDPQGWLNSSTYRFSPTIAGYYNITVEVLFAAGAVTNNQYNTQMRKNGNQIAIFQNQITTSVGVSQGNSRIVYLNGTTDYVEFTVFNGGSGAINISKGSVDSSGTYFSANLLVGGNLQFTGGTISGPAIAISGFSANTISATTYYNLPTDVRVTGATYSNNTFTYTNNTGGTFNVLFNTVTGLTVNGNLSAATIDQVNYIDFNTGATATSEAGRIKWNDTDGTYDMGLYQGVTLQVGQEQNVYGKASSAITNGDVVMYNGAQGEHILLAKANPALVSGNSFTIIGIATQDLTTNQFGYVTTMGKVRDLNTIAYSAGTTLYFNSTGTTTGGLTNVEPPAPYDNTVIATVIKSHATQGILFVRPTFRFPLRSLEDVEVTNVQNNDIIQYSGSVGIYVNTNSPKLTSVSATTMSAGTFTGNLTGLASLATSATTALSSTNATITNNTSTNGTYYPTFVSSTSGFSPLNVDSSTFTFNPSTNLLSVGAISATTYQNLPTDVRVTGGTYSTGTATFTNNTGGTFTVTGFNTGTVTSVAALTLGTSGSDLSSSVANGTTTPTITLNVPDASAFARGVVTTGNQTFGGIKAFTNILQITTSGASSTLNFEITGATAGSIVNSQSYFQLSTTATQGYLFKNYLGNNLLFLTTNGGAQFINSVTAGSFIKTGGTSTQFLKADGSVDSTTYVPTSRTLTINGTAYDLSADRTWTISGFSGGTVTGPTYFSNGVSANTISATTYLNLPSSTFTGGTVAGATNFTGGLTANTISATTVTANNFTGLASLATSATTAFSATNAANIYITDDASSNIDYYLTFVKNSNQQTNVFTDAARLTYNPSTDTLNTTRGVFSTIVQSANLQATTGITGATISATTMFARTGLSATTISATTYLNLPTDVYVTGGTFSTGTGTFRNNTGGTFTVTGFGTVTSVAALTLGTSGTDLSSTVANGTTTPVITLNVPDASATARGVINNTTQTIGGVKTFNSQINGTVGSFAQSAAGTTLYGNNSGTGGIGVSGGAGDGLGGYFVNNSTTYPVLKLLGLSNTRLLEGRDTSDNITSAIFSNGNVSGTSFIRTGGTSAQFLKADGSVDSTTYVPTSRTLTINGTAFDLSANRSWTLSDIRVTGGTYSSGTATFTNNTGGTFTVTGFSTGSGTFTGGTVTGPTYFSAGVSANTMSATTISAGTFTGNLTGLASLATSATTALSATNAVAAGITDNTTTNATYYPTFVDGTSGNKPLQVDSSTLTFNPSTNTLTVANLTGLASLATSATTALNATNTVNVGVTNNTTTNATYYLGFVSATSGNLPLQVDSSTLTFNPFTNTLTVDNLNGLASLATSATTALNATNAANIFVSNLPSTDAVLYPTFATGYGGNRALYADASLLTYNSFTDTLTLPNIVATGTITATTVTATTISATTVRGVTISATTYQNLPLDIRVTGGTYSSGTATFTNNTGGTFTVTGFSTGGGGTFTGGTVTGPTMFTAGMSANTISATTYLNLPTDIRVTGGTYSSGTATFTNNTGGTFTVTGFSTGGGTFTGGTVTGPTNFTAGLTANTISATTITAGTLSANTIIGIGGLQNYVAKFTSNGSFLGNSQLYDNGTSIGVGMTSPSATAKLDVAGIIRTEYAADPTTGATTAKFLSYSPSPYGLLFRGYSSGAHSIQNQREANNAQVYPLVFQPLGGSVGIGTLTPARLLDVAGDALINGLTVGLGNSNYNNVAFGVNALNANTTGYNNVAIHGSLALNTTGENNVGVGYKSLAVNTIGNRNVSVGTGTLQLNTVGEDNIAVGTSALYSNDSGTYNIAVGTSALYTNTTANYNIAIGNDALYYNDAGRNVAIGAEAGRTLTGGGNLIIGNGNNVSPDNVNLGAQDNTLSIAKNTLSYRGVPHFWSPQEIKLFPGSDYILLADPTIYSAIFIDYSLEDQSGNLRAGTLKGIFTSNLSSIKWDEVTTSDIGSTAAYTFNFIDNGSGILGVELTNSAGGGLAVWCSYTSRLIARSPV